MSRRFPSPWREECIAGGCDARRNRGRRVCMRRNRAELAATGCIT
jgi:hypothetical protein